MADRSKIEWTESTWNPITGCTKVSPGCKNCYAERIAKRLQAMGSPSYNSGFKVTLHPDVIALPLKWRKPRIVFVNSMSDLFHEKIPTEYIQKVFRMMDKANHHTFQILTKRSDRLRLLAPILIWPKNVWMGVSVESEDYISRVHDLAQVPSVVRFISLEPLLGQISTIPLDKIDWVIVGGESGPKARTMSPEWVRNIREQCKNNSVPFFFKQWGGVHKKKNGRMLDGKIYNEMPSRNSIDENFNSKYSQKNINENKLSQRISA
ncbi:MAG: hypothetical protein C0417_04510 [Chlorobiaceae bacterium]|nr:hypothetical protein [Chlorobiaceae bacterium]